MRELDEHYAVVRQAIEKSGWGWHEWPEAVSAAPIDNRVRLSALLLLLATEDPGVEVDGAIVAVYDPAIEVMSSLRRRKLPWDAKAARLAVALVSEGRLECYRLEVALRAAEAVCAAGEADAALVRELQDCSAWLSTMDRNSPGVLEMLRLTGRAISLASPPDLLDLSVLQPGDAWVGPATAAARALPADVVAPLVRTLGRLGAGKPPKAWLRAVDGSLRATASRELVKVWLELAANTDLTLAHDEDRRLLFAHGNDDMVRALVFATRFLSEEPWVPGVLGVLARRGAAPCGDPGIPASLSLKVASAAVETLIARGTPSDRDVLEQLLEDLSRRDLVKRIGQALGREVEAANRSEALRREKANNVRRKADPAPRQARAAADRLIRRHLTPTLRRAGFAARGHRWVRVHADRVDAVQIGSSGREVHLSYGTRFDAAHPEGEPYPVERIEAGFAGYLDVQLVDYWEASEDGMQRCSKELEDVVIPFLDTLGRYELASAFLELDAGRPSTAHRMDEPDNTMVIATLGLLALAAGDRDAAVSRLHNRLSFVEDWASRAEPSDRESADAEVRFWRAQVDRARRLN